MARAITIKAFEAWIADEANLSGVLERIAGGLTLQKTAVAVKQPYTCLYAFFHSTPELEGRYLGARKAWVAAKKDEAFEIAEGVAPDRDHVAKAKLQIEVIDNQAKAYDRERWGDQKSVDVSVTHGVDSGLIGTAGDLLKIAQAKRLPERVVVGDTLTLPKDAD